VRKTIITASLLLVAASGLLFDRRTGYSQTEFTMNGVWDMTFSAVNGELISRQGNTLGFPDREMTFEEQGDFKLARVTRGELGRNVIPLGVWRINADRFSATFQLWCPEADNPCGSVIMRGRFVDENKVKGTSVVYFDEADPNRPTGFDTWPNAFRGNRRTGGAN
jgi:hypothetical protein